MTRTVTVQYHDEEESIRQDIEIDDVQRSFVCPDCGRLISHSCANGHRALAIEETFDDVY